VEAIRMEGEGGQDGRGGGGSDSNNEDNDNNAQQLHKYKKITLYAYLSSNSCGALEATQWHTNPWGVLT
jgi:hypothetical protein